MYFSSVSSTASGAPGARLSAEVRPGLHVRAVDVRGDLRPSGRSAAVISRVVVVLPLVPVTRTTRRPCASRDSRSGSSRRPMMPPMTDPSPFPARRDTVAAAPPTVVASLARIGSLERWCVLLHRGRCYLVIARLDEPGSALAPVQACGRRSQVGLWPAAARPSAPSGAGRSSGAGRAERTRFGERGHRRGREAADRRIGVGEEHSAPRHARVAHDHRGGRQPLQLAGFDEELPRPLEGLCERLVVTGRERGRYAPRRARADPRGQRLGIADPA